MEGCPIDDYDTGVKLLIGTKMDEIKREVREKKQFEFREKSFWNEHFLEFSTIKVLMQRAKGTNFKSFTPV